MTAETASYVRLTAGHFTRPDYFRADVSNWLNVLVARSNGRPFTRDEADRVAEYAESLPDRLSAAKKLEDSAKWFARQFSDAVADRAERWGLPREPLVADFAANLVQLAHAMILDDVDVLADTAVAPDRSLARALDLPAEDYGELYRTAWAILAKRLEPRPAALLRPYFDYAAAALCGESQSLVETLLPVEV